MSEIGISAIAGPSTFQRPNQDSPEATQPARRLDAVDLLAHAEACLGHPRIGGCFVDRWSWGGCRGPGSVGDELRQLAVRGLLVGGGGARRGGQGQAEEPRDQAQLRPPPESCASKHTLVSGLRNSLLSREPPDGARSALS